MTAAQLVALLTEGVGRNTILCTLKTIGLRVALLTEGVGRNRLLDGESIDLMESPSSRRAWVEIAKWETHCER